MIREAPPFSALLTTPTPWLIAVIHLPPLPGAPGAGATVRAIAERAREDARACEQAGFTAVMIENTGDAPFRPDHLDPETVAALAVVAEDVARHVACPVGVNALRNDALSALGVAVASGADFLRVNVLAGVAATDQGLITGRADELLRRRAALGASIAILADVDVKHATSLDTRPVPLRARELVQRAGADAVLVTGPATGQPPEIERLGAVAEAVRPAPVLAASGTSAHDVAAVLALCAGTVVATSLQDPHTRRIDPARARAYARAAGR